MYRKDVPSNTIARGGVLIAIHHSVPSEPVSLNSTLPVVAARIHINRRPITLCSIYLPPGEALPSNDLSSLVSELHVITPSSFTSRGL